MKKKGRKTKGRRWNTSFTIISGIATLFIIVAIFGLLFLGDKVGEKAKKRKVAADSPIVHHNEYKKKKVAIIIDDIGYDLRPVEEILKLEVPVTLSILPLCPYSKEAAERAHHAGNEVMLHLPMEPADYPAKNPGDGALFLRMSRRELLHQLDIDLNSVPHASGVNNHMGSRFMEDAKKVEIIFKKLKKKNLFFVDSYTTRKTTGKKMAAKIGLKFAGRDVFIDNHADYNDTLAILKRAIARSEGWNTLVIIGHPYESTIRAMETAVPMFKAKKIQIVRPSELLG